MKILVCPDKFKGCLSSVKAAQIIARGISSSLPQAEVIPLPMADGGEGTAEVLLEATGGRRREVEVSDPLGRRILSYYVILGGEETAVIEMAAASGFSLLLPEERDPLKTSTYGTGELIRAALDDGFRNFIVAIGGSATNDGGIGMASALGVRFLDERGRELPSCGKSLGGVCSIELSGLDPRARDSHFVVASDVTNPLLGPEGATRVYGVQKGASPKVLEDMERGMAHYARVVEGMLGRRISDIPGAGAAGGLGFGLIAFLQARVVPGVEVVMEALRFEEKMGGCDLIITGEGKLDVQTAYGKTVSGVARKAREKGIPLIIMAGDIKEEVAVGLKREGEVLDAPGDVACLSITPAPMELKESLAEAEAYLYFTAKNVGKLLRMGMGLRYADHE